MRISIKFLGISVASFCFILVMVPLAYAGQYPWYTNDNFYSVRHDAPESFWSDGSGGFVGRTQTGKIFYQTPVVSDMQVRLQRFSIDDAFFYISSLGLIRANSDAEALSIYLARAGWEDVT